MLGTLGMSDVAWPGLRKQGAPPALVVGTMNFGKRTPEAEARRTIDRALERGLTWFDTANAYVGGVSEEILGRALRGRRGAARIATKVGIGTVGGPREGLKAARVQAALEESLKRLGTDHVDLYYLHAPDPQTEFEETLGAMEAARAAGKIGAWAVSNHASWQVAQMLHLCDARGWPRPQASQVIYNLLIRQLDLEYFAFARKVGLHTTVYNPLAGGLLAGRGLEGIEPGSRFDQNPIYQRRYLSSRFFELTRAYAALAADAGLTPVQLAYSWIASRPGVDSVLLGPADAAQLDAGIDGCLLPLPEGLAAKVDEIHRAYVGTEISYAR